MYIRNKDFIKLVIVITICFLTIWKVYIFNQNKKNVDLLKKQITDIKQNITNNKRKYGQLIDKKFKLFFNNEKNKELEYYVLNSNSKLLSIIDLIYEKAKENNIENLNTSTGNKKNFDKYVINEFLILKGTSAFQNLYEFINSIDNIKYKIQINELNITKTKNEKVDFSIKLICYLKEPIQNGN